jgi:hypothetical protein
VISTSSFVGVYLGIDLGYRLITINKSGIDLLGGIAWDYIETLDNYNDRMYNDGLSKRLNSLNLNIGIGYKFTLNKRRKDFLGLDVKYNFVDYNNQGGSDLSGNTISIQLLYGFSRIGVD